MGRRPSPNSRKWMLSVRLNEGELRAYNLLLEEFEVIIEESATCTFRNLLMAFMQKKEYERALERIEEARKRGVVIPSFM